MDSRGFKRQDRPTSELLAAEDAGWDELHALMDSLTPEEMEEPGYYREGWSAKDLYAHIGSWLAEAGVFLIRIRTGTYELEELDIDAMNRNFLEIMKDVPIQTVRAQASAARSRMLLAWGELPERVPEAAFWIRKAGAEHYAEHLPRLREWVTKLRPPT
ncbi:MAG TPA: maleylpyruvate isomerase N-terminal domain-containing protein [Rubrobacter sp.]|nr:maleylpyruvate isomerase N-terminal domain-containing protein [Rubrobacter sp.]